MKKKNALLVQERKIVAYIILLYLTFLYEIFFYVKNEKKNNLN